MSKFDVSTSKAFKKEKSENNQINESVCFSSLLISYCLVFDEIPLKFHPKCFSQSRTDDGDKKSSGERGTYNLSAPA